MIWTHEMPTRQGKYWYYECGVKRVVSVWGYRNKPNELFTNEDGGSSLDKDFYKGFGGIPP